LFQLKWPDERSKAAAILAAVSGMRINEITALRREDMDTERQVIHLRHSYSVYEKRLKGTKNERPRFIYTDTSILTMLSELHEKSPLQSPFVFWGVENGKPMRYETTEAHLEKVLAVLMGEQLKAAVNSEWRSLAAVLVPKIGIESHEMIAISLPNINA
jgi:integrase